MFCWIQHINESSLKGKQYDFYVKYKIRLQSLIKNYIWKSWMCRSHFQNIIYPFLLILLVKMPICQWCYTVLITQLWCGIFFGVFSVEYSCQWQDKRAGNVSDVSGFNSDVIVILGKSFSFFSVYLFILFLFLQILVLNFETYWFVSPV